MPPAPITTDYVRLLFDHAYWARDRLLAAVDGIDAADYLAERSLDYGSLHGTFVHLLSAEVVWRNRWLGVSPRSVLTPADVPDLGALRRLWALEEAKLRAFIQDLSDADLAREVHYFSTSGEQEYRQPLWQLAAHVANHATQHRAEAALVLTGLGRSPGDLDLIVYLREHLCTRT